MDPWRRLTYGLVHVFRKVRHVEVRVLRVAQGLQLSIVRFLRLLLIKALDLYRSWQARTYSSPLCFVPTMEKATDAILAIDEVVVFDEPEATTPFSIRFAELTERQALTLCTFPLPVSLRLPCSLRSHQNVRHTHEAFHQWYWGEDLGYIR